MSEENETQTVNLVDLTADIVAAYVSNNPVPVGGLPSLIESIHSALSGIGQSAAVGQPKQEPAVNPKRSVFPDHIVCLEDGKKFKTLKRHLSTDHGLTPDEYREKWGLKPDYPMVAPNYAAQRSELAKASGLGRKAPWSDTRLVRQHGLDGSLLTVGEFVAQETSRSSGV